MSVLVVGVSHRSAPVSLLERVALDAGTAGKLALDVQASPHVAEVVVLSTCNRVEVYADVARFHDAVGHVSDLLARHSGAGLDELTAHLYVHYEDRAVQHAFEVACGLDSMVVGESQILGQVRTALSAAQQAGTAGRVLNELLQQALRVGKRAHAETGIDAFGPSLVSVGLELAEQAVGPLAGRTALVVGAGSMSALAATTLARSGVSRLLIANRTPAVAQRLAARVGGTGLPLSALGAALGEADLVVSCTGALEVIVPADLVAATAAPGRARFFLDLALPRDVAPEVRDLDGCTVVDLERLAGLLRADAAAVPSGQSDRSTGPHGEPPVRRAGVDVDAVRAIVAEEVPSFLAWQRAVAVTPTVVALRSMAAEVVDAELSRLGGRLPDLDPRAQAEVALAVRRVVDKLLHAPTVRVKQLATDPAGTSYAEALRELFDLDPATVAAVSRADMGGVGGGAAGRERT